MPEGVKFISEPSQFHLVLAAISVFGLFLLAVLMDYLRRRRDRRLLVEAGWRSVRQIAREKELSSAELAFLEELIGRHSPAHPHRLVTVKQEFDRAVAREMERLEEQGGEKALAEGGLLLRDIRTRFGLDYIPIGQRIDTTRELYHAQPVWVGLGDAKAPEWFRMSVADVDEAHFHLAPHRGGAPPIPKAGDYLRCRLWREDDARYIFTTKVDSVASDPPLWALRHAVELNRVQSRAHFRIHLDQTVGVEVLNAPVDDDMSDVDRREAVTRLRGRVTSLSGGGLAIVVQQPIPKHVLLRITLDLVPEPGPLRLTARPVGSSTLSAGKHLVRCAFAGISDEVREAVSQYVFHRQGPIQAAEAHSQGEEE